MPYADSVAPDKPACLNSLMKSYTVCLNVPDADLELDGLHTALECILHDTTH